MESSHVNQDYSFSFFCCRKLAVFLILPYKVRQCFGRTHVGISNIIAPTFTKNRNVTGHDRPELYELALPRAGSVLELRRTIGIATPGQAIDWDPVRRGRLWSIGRGAGDMVASDLRLP